MHPPLYYPNNKLNLFTKKLSMWSLGDEWHAQRGSLPSGWFTRITNFLGKHLQRISKHRTIQLPIKLIVRSNQSRCKNKRMPSPSLLGNLIRASRLFSTVSRLALIRVIGLKNGFNVRLSPILNSPPSNEPFNFYFFWLKRYATVK